ncbi:MAG: hypothetical protein WAK57_18665, partial [Desulfobacterales bacterium]
MDRPAAMGGRRTFDPRGKRRWSAGRDKPILQRVKNPDNSPCQAARLQLSETDLGIISKDWHKRS